MKVLFNHADSFEYGVTKKAISSAEPIEVKTQKAENALVAFMAVEKADEGKEDALSQRVFEETKKIYDQVKADVVVVYPYAHLSHELSSPDTAKKVLDKIYALFSDAGYKTLKAPFGWYKSFKIHCKGHPMSELSRAIYVEEKDATTSASASPDKKEVVSEALKAEEKLKSTWKILTPDGKLHDIEMQSGNIKGFDFSKYPELKKLAMYEMAKSRAVDKIPPHVTYMKKLELVDYEPGSDPGNLRYYPKGRMIKGLLEDLVDEEVRKYGAMEIEAPIMYDFEHPSLKKYLNRFPARQYTIQTPNKKVFLRFAACFGQFLMLHDSVMSYKDLPVKLYELTKYSFRVEKRGELTGLRRLRSFTMPDCHAFCRDVSQAKQEMKTRFDMSLALQEKIGLGKKDFEFALRIVKDFWQDHKDFVTTLAKEWDKPLLVEMWDKKFFYFVMKYEFNFIDSLQKASALTTDQIDVENSKTYDITYVDEKGEKKNPIIMHLSPSGAIERVMYALLERAYMQQQKGIPPELPLWLSPTQVRIIPVTEKQLPKALEAANKLSSQKIRADVDDRDLTLGKKIREASQEWCPYIAVIGEKEANESKLNVRVRNTKKQSLMASGELSDMISKQTSGYPFRPVPVPMKLSKRVKFVG